MAQTLFVSLPLRSSLVALSPSHFGKKNILSNFFKFIFYLYSVLAMPHRCCCCHCRCLLYSIQHRTIFATVVICSVARSDFYVFVSPWINLNGLGTCAM